MKVEVIIDLDPEKITLKRLKSKIAAVEAKVDLISKELFDDAYLFVNFEYNYYEWEIYENLKPLFELIDKDLNIINILDTQTNISGVVQSLEINYNYNILEDQKDIIKKELAKRNIFEYKFLYCNNTIGGISITVVRKTK